MRILQISHNYHIVGGSDAVFFATSDLLRSDGHEVIPFCMDSPKNQSTQWDRFFPTGVDNQSKRLRDGIRYLYNNDARTQLKALLGNVGHIDVAHLHIYHGKQTPAILSVLQAHKIPIIQTLHEYKLACPVYTMQRNGRPCDLCVNGSDLNSIRHRCKDNSFTRTLIMAAEKSLARLMGDVQKIDRFLCVSDFQRQIMLRAGLPANRLFTLHNFVAASVHGGAVSEDYFLYFGRIEETKGVQTLVDAFKRNGRRLIIAGDGNWRRNLEQSISDVANIEYVGFQSGQRLTNLIRRCHGVVVPSQWYENCPMSVLEAKALGRPVIGANIGGIPELVRDGVDGFLFAPGDVAGLVAAIDKMDDKTNAKLAKNALMDAKDRFSSQMHLRTLLAHYQKVIHDTNKPEQQTA